MLQEDIKTALEAVSGLAGKVYPQAAADKPGTPYAVYQVIASPAINTLADGQPILQSRIQIDFYHPVYASVQTLAVAAKTALLAAFPRMTQQLRQDFFEADTKLHRVMHDYQVWHDAP